MDLSKASKISGAGRRAPIIAPASRYNARDVIFIVARIAQGRDDPNKLFASCFAARDDPNKLFIHRAMIQTSCFAFLRCVLRWADHRGDELRKQGQEHDHCCDDSCKLSVVKISVRWHGSSSDGLRKGSVKRNVCGLFAGLLVAAAACP